MLSEHLTFLSVNQHKNEFEKLIADMQKRKKGQRNKSAHKSKDDNSRTSSVIPEPPSSPSLVSLEEDEPGTPSLGLEDDDWVSCHFD